MLHLQKALKNFKAAERHHTRGRGSLGKLTSLPAQVGGGDCSGKITFTATGQVQDRFRFKVWRFLFMEIILM